MKIGKKYLTPLLPLSRGKTFDFDYIDETPELIRQNFKNLLLTSPGERVMNPEFGVGVRNYLFEDMTQIKKDLKERIRNQIRQYMPYIVLTNIKTTESSDNSVTVTLISSFPNLGTS